MTAAVAGMSDEGPTPTDREGGGGGGGGRVDQGGGRGGGDANRAPERFYISSFHESSCKYCSSCGPEGATWRALNPRNPSTKDGRFGVVVSACMPGGVAILGYSLLTLIESPCVHVVSINQPHPPFQADRD